ncbi:MAG: TraB/GumN family protein [Proteobacteria bacterium]|nr:TraB/GumN family protein [Desulfocapsa sp.]MBU3943438.1 TraB/GumN family protein [Pseudomonadota bacterium]MCG2743934.1 TraB/GumN family protein [Desulfobacteraceae bacterium]MBU4030444.1 TraB/GumN family protein [Pseudomonadota bacterium]MBU4044011.1 TraB/GumN family protein [Pseudomonadota bacterium]
MSQTHFPSKDYPEDVHVIHNNNRTILLVGTAHISQESVALVQEVIQQERPDGVCIELDEKRYQALTEKKKWQALDLKQIIKDKQLSTLMINLLMASYQKKLGKQLGVKPGAELLAAAKFAKEQNIPITLCDRDVRITLRRAWKSTSLFKKGYLLTTLFASLFDKTEISEEKLAELKQKDVLSELMGEMGEILPNVKKVLIDERDIYLSEKIKATTGNRLVAVVGAGHVAGIQKLFAIDNRKMLDEISTIPPISKGWKIAGWSFPLLIIGSIIAIGLQKGGADAGSNLLYWILANGIPSAIGGILALAHPLTIIGAFVAAPITSLTPVIGAGYVAAFIQVMMNPPLVREFETVGDDMGTIFGWWKNKLLRVFLVFLLTGIGSSLGTYIGGYEIIKNLIH